MTPKQVEILNTVRLAYAKGLSEDEALPMARSVYTAAELLDALDAYRAERGLDRAVADSGDRSDT